MARHRWAPDGLFAFGGSVSLAIRKHSSAFGAAKPLARSASLNSRACSREEHTGSSARAIPTSLLSTSSGRLPLTTKSISLPPHTEQRSRPAHFAGAQQQRADQPGRGG